MAMSIQTHTFDQRRLPIGIFDSGVGGLTILRELIAQLPHEDILYMGDTGHGPYGSLPTDQIRHYVLQLADQLVSRGVKALVIACNTASAIGIDELRYRYDLPIIEVISPTVAYSATQTHNGKVGVLATPATIASGIYQRTLRDDYGLEPYGVSCPRFVDFIERGITTGRQVLGLTHAYLEPLQHADIDTLILGCTHYPMLGGLIQLTIGSHVQLISNAPHTIMELTQQLHDHHLLAPPRETPPIYRLEATGDPHRFIELARRFLGPALSAMTTMGSSPPYP